MPMDFTSVQKAGSRLGTGTMIVLDDRTCPVGMVWNLEAFLRAGIVRLVHAVLERACHWVERHPAGDGGRARPDPEIWRALGVTRGFSAPGHTFCALAPGAAEPLQSALKYFRDDFERHIQRTPLSVEIDDGDASTSTTSRLRRSPTARTCCTPASRWASTCPYFCWHPALGSVGACRQCAVKQFKDENDTHGKHRHGVHDAAAAEGTRISIDDRGGARVPRQRHRGADGATIRTIARSATRAASATCRT